MDRLSQLRGEEGGSKDSTLDITSPPSEAFLTANESSSKFYSLSEVDSTFDISGEKDGSLVPNATESAEVITSSDELIANLSPISKKSDVLDSYKIGKQIEAANILSGGVDIFDDNENSYDGDELVIDDNVEIDEKSNPEIKTAQSLQFKSDNNIIESTLIGEEADIGSKDTEVVLQIDGKNVDAIDIGNGLYLYRKEGEEELAAVQIIDDDQQQPSFKFLKVRENAEGNLEVYEEIEIEVSKEVPTKEGKTADKNTTSHVPIKDINKVISESTGNKNSEHKTKSPQKEPASMSVEIDTDVNKDLDNKSDINLNGKMMKFTESRKSPVIGSFTPMTYHSTPNKEGKPLTKIMVDQQLHPNRHSDNVKKTIEVHTDSLKQRQNETPVKNKEFDDNKLIDIGNMEKEIIIAETSEANITTVDKKDEKKTELLTTQELDYSFIGKNELLCPKDNVIDSLPTTEESKDTKQEKNIVSPNIPMDSEKVKDPVIPMDVEEGPTNIDSINKVDDIISMNIEEEIKDNTFKEAELLKVDNLKDKDVTCNKVEDVINVESIDTLNKDGIIEKYTLNSQKEISPKAKSTLLEKSSQHVNDAKVSDQKIAVQKNSSQSITSTKVSTLTDKKEAIVVDSSEKNKESKHIAKDEIVNKNIKLHNEFYTGDCIKQKDTLVTTQSTQLADKLEHKKTEDKLMVLNIAPANVDTNKDLDTLKDHVTLNKHTTRIEKSSRVTSGTDSKQVKNDKIGAPGQTENKHGAVERKSTSNLEKEPSKYKDIIQSVQELQPAPLMKEKVQNKPVVPSKVLSKSFTDCKLVNAKIEPNTVPKIESAKDAVTNIAAKNASHSTLDKKGTDQSNTNKIESKDKIEIPKVKPDSKAINNHAAVPFGKWTDANRQEFLSKFKAKIPATSSNGNQIKNSNDLNRRDILKKIDSQRQSNNALSKTQDANKLVIKNETAFSKSNISQESKIPVKTEALELKVMPVVDKLVTKQEKANKSQPLIPPTKTTTGNVSKKESTERKEVNYQDLIDKTIEDMLHRGAPTKNVQDEQKNTNSYTQNYPPIDEVATLDALEMKMNELHGIPFIERPPHELPQVQISDLKMNSKQEIEKQTVSTQSPKIPILLPFTNKNKEKVKENLIEVDSEEEIIEHEPITGDIGVNKNKDSAAISNTENISCAPIEKVTNAPKKEAIITEGDFDKFARRNSITVENCITVSFDNKEPHNIIQTVMEKDMIPKSSSKNDISRIDHKTKIPNKYQNTRQNINTNKHHSDNKFEQVKDDPSNRSQSKLQKAYHSALTAKRQMECPITIIEDKPVKVVFMDNVEFVPSQLNVQGQDLSPIKKLATESDIVTIGTAGSVDSDMLDTVDDAKSQDEVKIKTKHQRKQVLTPVEEPELELIEPTDLGLETSPKKKRKTEDDKADKINKYPMRKKIYMLGANTTEEKQPIHLDVVKNPLKETLNRNENLNSHSSSVSAIDNLVKAAELLENQTENMIDANNSNPNSQQSTPVKRGRGRPRKYPLPDGILDKTKVPSPQKKPKLIDATPAKRDTISDEEVDSDGEIVQENWTMGKINENIVCPICNKLFRTENVVFKHVKHCTGPSPNRSDSDKRSPRRFRQSQESDDTKSHGSKSEEMDIDDEKLSDLKERKETPKKHNSKVNLNKDEVIVIEDTPDKEKLAKDDDRKQHESRKLKSKIPQNKNNDLVCEFCGKIFRQLSYLANHKLQHKRDDSTKGEKGAPVANKSVYSCEICKKEFRKLHHLVQHRIIHNPSSGPGRSLRKSFSEQAEKTEKEPMTPKQGDDPSAAFRCEPCDKSFRKLHHLVEHRETHDGINRQKSTTVAQNNLEKAVSIHTCEICKKTFKKLQHLIEHKEQHMDTGSENDDKSVKSSLSTKDIIHECSLCYMVFPNEHSLNKHTVICQRKKRQSKQKQAQKTEGTEDASESIQQDTEVTEIEDIESHKPITEEVTNKDSNSLEIQDIDSTSLEKKDVIEKVDIFINKSEELEEISNKGTPALKVMKEADDILTEHQTTSVVVPIKKDNEALNKPNHKNEQQLQLADIQDKSKKIEEKEAVTINDKKNTPHKDKIPSSVSKRSRVSTPAVPKVETKPVVESSDDDEVRYMINPNFKIEETEEKVFMKVRAKKRSSLQIERPNSKDLVKRRISLQHPPKIPRLKQKSTDSNTPAVKQVVKTPKLEPVPSTDSDDSDVKYSFPKIVSEKPLKPAPDRTPKVVERKTPRKTLTEKRKSLSAIAKRKSLGKAVTSRHRPSPLKPIKKRTTEVEHRCDCGQLFSSGALLARHTSLAHTPPRIRRRRSPPPAPPAPPAHPAPDAKHRASSRKSNGRSEPAASTARKSEAKPGRKSVDKSSKTPGDPTKPKSGTSASESGAKPRRGAAHRGVPVPEKMRNLMQKNKQ